MEKSPKFRLHACTKAHIRIGGCGRGRRVDCWIEGTNPQTGPALLPKAIAQQACMNLRFLPKVCWFQLFPQPLHQCKWSTRQLCGNCPSQMYIPVFIPKRVCKPARMQACTPALANFPSCTTVDVQVPGRVVHSPALRQKCGRACGDKRFPGIKQGNQGDRGGA